MARLVWLCVLALLAAHAALGPTTHAEQIQKLTKATAGYAKQVAMNEDGSMMAVLADNYILAYFWDGSSYVSETTLYDIVSGACDSATGTLSYDRVLVTGNWVFARVTNAPVTGGYDVASYYWNGSGFDCPGFLWADYISAVHASIDDGSRELGASLSADGSYLLVTGGVRDSAQSNAHMFTLGSGTLTYLARSSFYAHYGCVIEDSASGDALVAYTIAVSGESRNKVRLVTFSGGAFGSTMASMHPVETAYAIRLSCGTDRLAVSLPNVGVTNDDVVLVFPMTTTTTTADWTSNGAETGSLTPIAVVHGGNQLRVPPTQTQVIFEMSRDGNVLIASNIDGNCPIESSVVSQVGSFHWFLRDLAYEQAPDAEEWGEIRFLFPREDLNANTHAGEDMTITSTGDRAAFTVLNSNSVYVYDKSFCTVRCLDFLLTGSYSDSNAICGSLPNCWCGHISAPGQCITQEFY